MFSTSEVITQVFSTAILISFVPYSNQRRHTLKRIIELKIENCKNIYPEQYYGETQITPDEKLKIKKLNN
jgi:hypothetical protein